MKEEAYSQLKTAVSQWVELSEKQWQQLATIFGLREAETRQHIVLPGAIEHEIIFVNQGLLRFYYLGEDGEETNKAFIGENEFAGPLASAALGLPLYFGIQALEETQMLVAQYSDYINLFEQDLVFDINDLRVLSQHLRISRVRYYAIRGLVAFTVRAIEAYHGAGL